MVGGGKGGLVVLTWRRETHKERVLFLFFFLRIERERDVENEKEFKIINK